MNMYKDEEALAMWKEAGLWDKFKEHRLKNQSYIPIEERRIYYGQKNHQDPKKNFLIVFDDVGDEEKDNWLKNQMAKSAHATNTELTILEV